MITIGSVNLDWSKLFLHPERPFILTIFHIENDLQALDMAHKPLRELASKSPINSMLVISIELFKMRLTCSLIREAAKLLRDVPKHPFIQELVNRDEEAKEALEYFRELRINGKYEEDFKKFKGIRDLLTFHYRTRELKRFYASDINNKINFKHIVPIYHPAEDDEIFPMRYLVIDELNMKILKEDILKVDGEDQQALEKMHELTSMICGRFMAISGAIVEGVFKKFHIGSGTN
jgi:hypothetical protein